ncbi:MAG: hypothetical protein ACR5K4_03230 [Sodalis sp. (in: enterobacteria)]
MCGSFFIREFQKLLVAWAVFQPTTAPSSPNFWIFDIGLRPWWYNAKFHMARRSEMEKKIQKSPSYRSAADVDASPRPE